MTKISKIAFLTFTVFLISINFYGQKIREDNHLVKMNSDTKKKSKMLADSLSGKWILLKNVCDHEEEKTGLKINLDINSSKKYSLIYKLGEKSFSSYGKYSLEIISQNGIPYFYLRFKKSSNEENAINGYLVNFSSNEFVLQLENNCFLTFIRE